jgi:hypothetical protein
MPFIETFIDGASTWLVRAARRQAWLEHLLAIAGALIVPLSLVTLVVTGELMAYGWQLEGLPPFATLRGMHVLAGGMLLLVVGYHAARTARRWIGRGPVGVLLFLAPGRWRTWMAGDWPARTVRAGGWLCLLLLVATGAIRHARLRYGWSFAPPGDAAWWDVAHVTAVPYLYGFLLLEAYLALRRWLPALRDYLVRYY